MTPDALAAEIRSALRAEADPMRAAAQQAYMKSALPYLGLRVPQTRRIARELGADASAATLRLTARELWDAATHREEWYAALALLGLRQVRSDPRNVPLIEHVIRTGRWWDITDEVVHRITDLLDADPEATRALVLTWARESDMWLRRVAILSQLGRRDRTDRELLAAVIEPNRADPEFFIRKAIGWALRDVARVDPAWVRQYVGDHDLSPLSAREALKHMGAEAGSHPIASGSTARTTVTGAATTPSST